MRNSTRVRDLILTKGFFPEVLPPCFIGDDLKRCFKGLITKVEAAKFHKRSSAYIRYSGTKHDGNRRPYGTVNPIPYFSVCAFIGKNWTKFDAKISGSEYNLSDIQLGDVDDERAVLIPSLSEVIAKLSTKIKYAPYLVKADIAQYYPSIYTHAIAWVGHGKDAAKRDVDRRSRTVIFNSLDWFVQQCQSGQTRGLVIGPDAFRLVAEFIAADIDSELKTRCQEHIIGAVRHVDDFYIGIRSQIDSAIVLSHLREILLNFELQLNDSKTKVLWGLHAVDDVWAQELRRIKPYRFYTSEINYLLDKAVELSQTIESQSPVKLAIRRLDREKCYEREDWSELESKLQRIVPHFPHCLDYICLLLVKRYAIGRAVDAESWKSLIELALNNYISSNHHHEIIWLIWTSLVCNFGLTSELISKLCRVQNSHIKAILIAGFTEGLISDRPDIRMGSRLSTSDENWLHNLVARSSGFTSAPFTGEFAADFTHLASKKLKLIDFRKHLDFVSEENNDAISKSKYGYDSASEDNDDEEEDNDEGEDDDRSDDIEWPWDDDN
jgi:hypothetical protein